MDEPTAEQEATMTGGAAAGSAAACALVVGHDRGPAGAAALGVAVDLGRRLHAHLHVVHGITLLDYPVDPDAADWEQAAVRVLDEQHDRVEAALAGYAGRWTYHTGRGDPVAAIDGVADEHDALMIIVGSHGEGPGAVIDRLIGGSVSRGLLRRRHRPVLVVPARTP
ncbi:universal stress protein [Pseudonocardia sp. GCM10023141]|uniref:universal stress protein n=1 Tax=Pseudonocardia sp. GCM10023141 TaxID=3252653 RepID=UPI0036222E0D